MKLSAQAKEDIIIEEILRPAYAAAPTKKILDVNCGADGYTIIRLQPDPENYVGALTLGVDKAWDNMPLYAFFGYDLNDEKNAFRDESFGFVTLISNGLALYGPCARSAVIKNIKAALAPNGTVVISSRYPTKIFNSKHFAKLMTSYGFTGKIIGVNLWLELLPVWLDKLLSVIFKNHCKYLYFTGKKE